MALRAWHAQLPVGARVSVELRVPVPTPDPMVRAGDVLVGAGFDEERLERAGRLIRATVVRQRTLADTVGPRMRLLACGLNPSLYAADVGVAFARPGNRFWPALRAAVAGVTDRNPSAPLVDRDPSALLADHGIGLTDLVKRASVGADELTPAEYDKGIVRVERLCRWLAPEAVVLVGLGGWRAAVDRTAPVGWQPRPLHATPVYVMPSTSGRNAHTSPAQLADHFRTALAGAGQAV